MSKQCKIVDPELPSTSSISADFDWKECIFCQEQTKENLQCPANSKRSDLDVGTGYKTLETILERYTRDIVDPRVCETIRNVENLGKEQYHQFVTERLENKSKSLHVPIKQNKLLLFSRQQPKTETKDKQQITSLKQNCSLFSQLYVSCQVRNGDLEEFFRHENQSYPPALSQFGEMRLGSKSDLLVPLERLTELHEEAPNADVLVIDGAAIINMLKPRGSKTFEDYFNDIFMPYIHDQLRFVSRLDVVWDEYISNSLKASTRCKRGKGVRRRVLPDSRVPGNWEAFLRVNDNKTELFIYLAEQLVASARGSDEQKQIERYVILMYDKTSQCTKVNDARKDLFTRKGRAIDNIPPSESALLEHTKRAVYMASLCWGKCLEPSPQVGSPSEWGWQKDKTQMWIPY
ncbi:unnamed protein product [Mytilus edulis]|uniref:Uncharacterized protein n=1 Tax=Mytilus edulis TaxID=6550 RepID=A0A8S3SHW8_MYTED|nr:unnamed protein product [Mytilus edulis]